MDGAKNFFFDSWFECMFGLGNVRWMFVSFCILYVYTLHTDAYEFVN